ncbi:MAG TPA: biopolymer transporter ExbD [Rhizomicrobium sp.]|jgi:biopolymer transport protein ExbD|nr:biopolymer transporter ExbD [Rhizomicrobium sp.]
MAMTAETSDGDMLSEMNTTPLIDVMLVLLVLLIITLPMQTHAVTIDMPNGHSPATPSPVVMLEVDFDGTAIWNGWRISHATLEQRLVDAAHSDPQPEIHMMANRLARYGAVAQVMADAQRLGLRKIGLVDTQPY